MLPEKRREGKGGVVGKWVACGEKFITGDVIRWREAVWKPKARKTSKAVRIGERVVTAEVQHCGPEWAHLLVKACETQRAETWWKPIKEFKTGELLRRRRGPLGKGRAVRLAWSDESARALVVSKFVG